MPNANVLSPPPLPARAPSPPPSANGGGHHTIRSVLRRPRFTYLVIGQTVSQLGDRLHHMALIALVGASASANTGGLEFAKLSVVFTVPVVLFGPLAGALVDRWNKHWTMLVCDLLRAILVGIIPWLFAATERLWPVYVAAFFTFVLGAFFNAAKMALIPELVSREELLPANAALSFIGRFATVGGVVGGGVIIGIEAWKSLGWRDYDAGFYLDAVSYLVSVLMLIGIMIHGRMLWASPSPAPASPVPSHGGTSAVRPAVVKRSLAGLVGDVRDTLRVVRHEPGLRFVSATVVLLALFASTVYVAMIYPVQTEMGKGTEGVGYLGGILGAGMIVGSLLVGTMGHRWDKRRIILWGHAVMGLVMALGGVFFSFAMFIPVAFIGGAILAPVMVSQDTLLHEFSPASSRAVIFSAKDLILAAVFAVSALLVGGGIYLLGQLGVQQPYRLALIVVGILICGAGAVGEVAAARWRRRQMPSS